MLGVIPKKDKPRQEQLNPRLKAEIMKVRQYSEQIRFLCKHKIYTTEQLKHFISETKTKVQSCISERTSIYNKLRRCIDPERIKELKSVRDSLSTKISQYRKELKLANGVIENSDKIKENIKIERELKKMKTAEKEKSKINSRRFLQYSR